MRAPNLPNVYQSRVRVRPNIVRDYARAMAQQIAEGALRFPPVVLFRDGQHSWVGDGFHRVLAAREAGLSEFPAEVRPGTQREALLFSISANADHGLPRSNADKKKAVTLLLADAEWSQWSDREIARRCQVSHPLVIKLRRRASGNGYQIAPRRVRRGETVYEMRTETKAGQATATTPTDQAARASGPPAGMAIDGVGIRLPAATLPVFAAVDVFAAAEKLHDQLAELVDQLAHSPGGAAYLPHLLRRPQDGKPTFCSPELNAFRRKLAAAAPHCGTCPRCHARDAGRTNPTCKLCGGRRWLSKADFDVCPEPERTELLRLRE